MIFWITPHVILSPIRVEKSKSGNRKGFLGIALKWKIGNLFGGWILSRDGVGDVHERDPQDPDKLCSSATGRVQNPFCTRSAKSQAIDSPPNRF